MFFSCVEEDKSWESFSYRSITASDLEGVYSIWSTRDLSVQNVELVYETNYSNHRVLIFQHSLLGNIHYGTIAIPEKEDLSGVPVVIIGAGLDQDDRNIDSASIITGYGSHPALIGFIKIIPTFRGQTLHFNGNTYKAEGDFFDAYDGATDDSIGLLNVAEAYVPEGRYDKVLVVGGSRGGLTGLLLAMREPRINTVIAAAAPVDFYRKDVRNHYKLQYFGQFFRNKTHKESRQRMLACSPLFFEPLDNVENIFLHYGAADRTVPLWNAGLMYNHLLSQEIQVKKHVYEKGTHSSFYDSTEFQRDFITGVEQFLKNISE